MSAEPAPKPSPNQDLITRFRGEYGSALADARTSEEHTNTAGWQALYREHKVAVREKRRAMGKALGTFAKQVEDFGLVEDDEKAIKEVAKDSAALREMVAVFQAEAIDRVCAPVMSCENLITHYRAEAARMESAAPLHNVGIEELMRMECAKQPRPTFNAEAGTVEISES